MSPKNRVLIFTGKGGVGKSLCAYSTFQALKADGLEVALFTLDPRPYGRWDESLGAKPQPSQLARAQVQVLDPQDSLISYLRSKLGEIKFLSWFVETTLFKGIFRLLPGLHFVLFVGEIWNFLEKNPERVAVFDAPQSGHFEALYSANKNFRSIFREGILFSQLEDLQDFIQSERFQIHILGRPLKASLDEAGELKSALLAAGADSSQIHLWANMDLGPLLGDQLSSLPDFLRERFELEAQTLKTFRAELEGCVPFVEGKGKELVQAMLEQVACFRKGH